MGAPSVCSAEEKEAAGIDEEKVTCSCSPLYLFHLILPAEQTLGAPICVQVRPRVWDFFQCCDMNFSSSGCSGHCSRCGQTHSLPVSPALGPARELMQALEREGRIDLHLPKSEADPALSLDYLWGPARGQMFGVLVYEDAAGMRGLLKAFSCQYNGIWEVSGWVPPVFDVTAFHALVDPVEREIKRLGREIAALQEGEDRRGLVRRRKEMSRELMRSGASYRYPYFPGRYEKD